MAALPNFVVIGASRSGTTSLHDYLGQHPDVYVTPRKSPNYFVSADAQIAEAHAYDNMAADLANNFIIFASLHEVWIL